MMHINGGYFNYSGDFLNYTGEKLMTMNNEK